MNLSLVEEVWYTSERESPVIFRIAEQKLSFEVHSLTLQLDYGAQTTEAILESWKCIGPNIHLSRNPVECGYLLPRAVYQR